MTALNISPAYYDDLDLSFEEAWNLVEAGITNRNSPAHTPTVGTVDQTGTPQLRIMILRNLSRGNRAIRFHTDARSIKVEQIRQNPAASVLIYDPSAKVQIRLSGKASLSLTDDTADAAWMGSTPFARRCYMAEAAPGTAMPHPSSGLPEWIQGKQPEEEQLVDYRSNFAALSIKIESIEWLYLANVGHRRARWQFIEADNSWQGTWLLP